MYEERVHLVWKKKQNNLNENISSTVDGVKIRTAERNVIVSTVAEFGESNVSKKNEKNVASVNTQDLLA